MPPKISVIIPVYNEARDLADCLSSLSRQTYRSVEIIVVDDGSTDSSGRIAGEFPVLLLHQPHLGPGLARNLGAKHASGRILVFVDADMTFAPDFLDRLTAPIRAGRTIGTFSRDEYLKNADKPWARYWNLNRGLPDTRMHPPDYPDIQPVFRAVSKDAFDGVGGFDPVGYDDDYTLSRKLRAQAVAAPGAVFWHRNPDSLPEVWRQASWSARRRYKMGWMGKIITLVRTSFPVSAVSAAGQAIRYRQPGFFLFKIVYDAAVFISLANSWVHPFNYK